jgi:predicted branched-subunit amino acid permease
VAAAAGAYGVSFGALSVAAGLSVAQTCALSVVMFTGGSQFALIGVIGAGGTGLAAVSTAGLLGVRNSFYGLQVAPMLGVRRAGRLLAAQGTIDESTAVGTAQLVTSPSRPELARLGFWVTAGAVFVLWNLATVIGAGSVTSRRPAPVGLDAAAAAAFLALVWPRVRRARPRAVAGAAALVALVLIPVAPAGVPVLAAAVVGVLGAWRPE